MDKAFETLIHTSKKKHVWKSKKWFQDLTVDGFRLLRSTFGFTTHIIVIVIVVFPLIVIAFAKLGCKALVKEILASRERPSTHIDNVALLKIGLSNRLRLWIDIRTFGRE
jgi:hypothetical protein